MWIQLQGIHIKAEVSSNVPTYLIFIVLMDTSGVKCLSILLQ